MDSPFGLFIQVVISLVIFAVLRWAKSLRE